MKKKLYILIATAIMVLGSSASLIADTATWR